VNSRLCSVAAIAAVLLTGTPAPTVPGSGVPTPSADLSRAPRPHPFWLPPGATSEPTTSAAPGTTDKDRSGVLAPAPVVTPAEVIARAATWLTANNGGPVPYHPSRCFPGFTPSYCVPPRYRTDCSGFVSMALGLPASLVTGDMVQPWFAIPLSKDQLRRGDLMVNPSYGGDGHSLLFDRWDNVDHTRYWAYEQSGDGGTHHRSIPYPYYGTYPMSPYRYNRMVGAGAPDAAAAVSYRDELHIASRGADGSVTHSWRRGNTFASQNLGGILAGRPSIATYGSELHVVGANGGLVYQAWYDGARWQRWAPISTGSDPVAVSYRGEFHVVSLDPNGSVVHSWYGAAAWHTQNLGGTLAGPLSATVFGDGFYVVGAMNGTVYQKWFTGTSWMDWTPIARGSNPVALPYGGEFHVVSTAAGGNVLHTWFNGRVWTVQDLGGILTGTISATVYRGGFYVVGANLGTVYQRWYTGRWWTEWAPISSGGNPSVTTYGTEYHALSRWADGSVLDAWYDGTRWTSHSLPG
jgi:hypothetical protein